jgi:hypothetical protein
MRQQHHQLQAMTLVSLVLVALLLGCIAQVGALDNGLGQKPAMGFNT